MVCSLDKNNVYLYLMFQAFYILMLVVLLSRCRQGTPATAGSLYKPKAQLNDNQGDSKNMRQSDGITKGHQGSAPTENPYDISEDSNDPKYADILLE